MFFIKSALLGFQEEYAFRSAIALTVQTYGDIAGKNKEDLISNAVASIYKMPSMMNEKTSFLSNRNKHLNDTLRS